MGIQLKVKCSGKKLELTRGRYLLHKAQDTLLPPNVDEAPPVQLSGIGAAVRDLQID